MKAPFRAPPSLQEAWIRRLLFHFHFFNHYYAAGKLRSPTLLIGSSGSRLGEWSGLHRTITISETHILDHPWEAVLDTLRHEMAHQYVEDVLGLIGSPPHGEAFARAAHLFRVDPVRAARLDRLPPGGPSTELDRILRRIKELLAMAGSPNENEAANAMRLVHKYLLKYNLDLTEVERPRSFAVRHLGRCSGRFQEYEYTLGNILKKHYFVEVVWTFSYDPLRDQPGRILQIVGTPENLEIAEYVHRYVSDLIEPLWKAYREASGANGKSRRQYLAGLLRGLEEKLDRHTLEIKEEHGLVWKGDPLLKEYYRYLCPRLERVGGSGPSRGKEYSAGLRDGKSIVIRRGISSKSVNRGRLLGDGR